MSNQTPGEDQAQVNSVPWTNGKGLVTGATIMTLLTAIIGTFYLYGPLSGTNIWTGTNTFNGSVMFGNPSSARANLSAAASGANSDITSNGAAVFYAKAFGSCTWSPTDDGGPCINAAIASASTNGGGEVLLPCGVIGFATEIVKHNSGVHLKGCGIGMPRDPFTSAASNQATILKWTGGAASLGFDEEPIDGNHSMSDAGDEGFWIDGQNVLATVARISAVSYSNWKIGVLNRAATGFDLSTLAGVSSLGSQHNTGSFYEYTSSAPAGVGILFRKDPGSTLDWSLNNLTELYVSEPGGSGTPIFFANGDRNTIAQCTSFGGNPDVVANSADALPAGLTNGATMQTPMWRDMLLVANDCPIVVHGLMSGSSFAANTVSGTEGPTTIAVTTSATTSPTNGLNVASTTGIVAGEVLNLVGGYASGVAPNSTIQSVVSSTQLGMAQNIVGNVAASVIGTVSWGAIACKAASGSYTLAYNSGETGYDLTYSGSGAGHSQTAIKPSGGVLTFTDFIIPWASGSPVNADSWTITLPASTPSNIGVFAGDNGNGGNAIPDPAFEPNIANSGGCYGSNSAPFCGSPAPGQPVAIGPFASTSQALGSSMIIGTFNGLANGTRSIVVGGSGTSNLGTDNASVGGHSNSFSTITLNAACDGGVGNFLSGADSACLASNAGNDFARFGFAFQGSGQVNAAGDAQSGCSTFHGTSSGAAATVQATSNGAVASGNNVYNLVDNSLLGIGSISLLAFDHANRSNYYTASWVKTAAPYLLARGTGASSVTLNGGTSTISPDLTRTGGTTSGAAATVGPDTADGGVALKFTTPTGNSDQWIFTFRVCGIDGR